MRKLRLPLALFFLAAGCILAQDPPQPDSNGVYTPGPGIKSPEISQAASAVFPPDPNLRGTRHVSVLQVVISADGTPGAIEVTSAPSPFDAAAIEAVRESRFEPGRRKRQSVPVRIAVYVPFGVENQTLIAAQDLYAQKRATAPRVLNRIEAQFSDLARRKRIDGTVLISVTVDEHGMPVNIRVVEGVGYGLDEEAIAAVRQYRFDPARMDGMPIPVTISVEINFRLGQR